MSFKNSGLRCDNVRVFGIQVARSSVVLTIRMTVLLAIATAGLSPTNAGPLSIMTNRAASAPKAVVPFTRFTFGDVYTGEIISQIFVVRNDGDAELLIKDFKGDCGCTVTRSDRVIPPGKEGTADIEVQTISQFGLINKTAVLHTNDPERPTIIFTIVANVVKGPPQRQGKYISYKILVESLPIETGGLYTDQLRVITDNPTLPAFNIDVTLRVYPKQ